MRKWLTKKAATWMIVFIAILTLMLGIKATQVNFSFKFERFFSADNEDVALFQNYKQGEFFSDSRTTVAVELPNGLFNSESLNNLIQATDSLKRTPWVKKTMSIADLQYFIETPLGMVGFNYLDAKQPENFKEDSIRIAQSENIYRVFVGKDYHSAVVNIFTNFYLEKNQTDSLNTAIYEVFAHYGLPDIHVGGRLINQSIIIDKLKSEMGLFVSISLALVIITLYLVFKSFWGVVTPLVIVFATAVWNVGFMTIFGKDIDVFSALIPSILFIVGISDVIHIYTKYIDGLREGLEKEEAIWKAYKQVGMATFITSMTTSIGFLTLIVSGIAPIREFGVFMAIGVMTAFVLSFTLFPAAIILLPKPKIVLSRKKANVWDKQMTNLYNWVIAHKKLIGVASIVLFTLGALGTSQLKINSYLVHNLPASSDVRKSFKFLKENFSGMRNIDLFVTVKDSNKTVLDYEIAKEINLLDQYLKDNYQVGALISPASIIKQTNQAHLGGQPENFIYPNQEDFKRLKANLRKVQKNKFVKSIVLDNGKTGRITGNMDDLGSRINLQRNKALMAFAEENCPNVSVKLLGLSHFMDVNNFRVSKSLIKSLILAFMLISIIMAFLYRSFRIIAIASVPNILPLLLVGLLMYLTGVEIKVSTMLIFTIAYGIAVDDTIHFLGNLKIELNKGLELQEAIKKTFKTTGKSIILTTVILFTGFISHGLSDFTSSSVLGILVSSCLVFAVVIDLTLLPVLLLWLPGKKEK
jgi:predicted RND superfamily exporter protein